MGGCGQVQVVLPRLGFTQSQSQINRYISFGFYILTDPKLMSAKSGNTVMPMYSDVEMVAGMPPEPNEP